jgi:tetratricopeptide (TPR) repeat protein
VLAQLGFHLLKEGRLDEAARLFEAALSRSHDGWIFKGLTETYRKTGRIDDWIKAVETFLKTEDLALDHAHALEDLAKYLMEQKEFKKARPYAELAAQSWAGWAMISAARCAEETADWEAAERWISRAAERYPLYWLEWFFWCKRTGHGDAKAAAAYVRGQLSAGRTVSDENDGLEVAILMILDHRPKEARKLLDRLYNDQHGTIVGILSALACEMDGDTKARDAALLKVREQPMPDAPRTAAIFGVIGEWLAAGDKSPLDLKRLNEIFESISASSRPNTYVFAGVFLDRHGKPDIALDFLKRANDKQCFPWYRLIARDALSARNIDPGSFPW